MIACDKPCCEIEWYHYVCMSITRAPKGNGYALNVRDIALIKSEASL